MLRKYIKNSMVPVNHLRHWDYVYICMIISRGVTRTRDQSTSTYTRYEVRRTIVFRIKICECIRCMTIIVEFGLCETGVRSAYI